MIYPSPYRAKPATATPSRQRLPRAVLLLPVLPALFYALMVDTFGLPAANGAVRAEAHAFVAALGCLTLFGLSLLVARELYVAARRNGK